MPTVYVGGPSEVRLNWEVGQVDLPADWSGALNLVDSGEFVADVAVNRSGEKTDNDRWWNSLSEEEKHAIMISNTIDQDEYYNMVVGGS